MTSSPRVRRSRPEDIPALNELFAATFGRRREETVWVWKYFDNPFGTHSWVYENDDGKIIFHCGGTAAPFQVDGGEYRALQLTDFMSDRSVPAGFGPGSPFGLTVTTFFDHLVREQEIELLYGFPGERHRIVGEKLLGYQKLGKVHEVRFDPLRETAEAIPLDNEHLSGWDRALGDVPHVIRDEAWLRWRYQERPDRRYLFMREKDFRAILVSIEDGYRLMELDWESSSGLNDGVDRLRSLGRTVSGWFPVEHPRTRSLVDSGGVIEPRDHYLVAARFRKTASPVRRDYFEPEGAVGRSFYYTLGDYDVE